MDGEHCTLTSVSQTRPTLGCGMQKSPLGGSNCRQTTALTALQGASFVIGKCPQQAGATEWRGQKQSKTQNTDPVLCRVPRFWDEDISSIIQPERGSGKTEAETRESRGTKSPNLSAGLMDDTRGNRERGEGTSLTKAFIRASADSTSQSPGTQKWEAERSMGKLSPDGPGTMERDGKKLTENTWAPDYWSHPSRPRERPSPPTGNGRGEGRVLCPLLPCTCALAKRLLNPPVSPG